MILQSHTGTDGAIIGYKLDNVNLDARCFLGNIIMPIQLLHTVSYGLTFLPHSLPDYIPTCSYSPPILFTPLLQVLTSTYKICIKLENPAIRKLFQATVGLICFNFLKCVPYHTSLITIIFHKSVVWVEIHNYIFKDCFLQNIEAVGISRF